VRSGEVWSEIASWYDALLEAGSGPHETALAALLALVPEKLRGSVVDVGCGQGLATRALAERGADRVVGIDASEGMLRIARERTAVDLPISYHLDDAEHLHTCEDASLDGATCQLALMDIADLPAVLRSIRRVLKPGGWFAAVIGHPCFLAPHAETRLTTDGLEGQLIARYFEEEFWRSRNPEGIRGKAGNYHRPLSTYLNALIQADLQLEEVLEPRASALLSEQQSVYRNVPIFLAFRACAI